MKQQEAIDEEVGATVDFITYIRPLAKHQILTSDEELRLIRASQPKSRAGKAKNGIPLSKQRRRAFDRLLRHNVLLLMKFVHSYTNSARHVGMEHADLFSEAAVGLQMAVERFDTSSGNRLSTYAGPWIRQAITRAMDDKGSMIRVPVNAQERRRKIARLKQKAWSLGKELSNGTVAAELGITIGCVERSSRAQLIYVSVDRALKNKGSPQTSGATTYLEQMSDAEAVLADEEAAEIATRERSDELRTAMSKLSTEEQTVINWRFWEEMTLEEAVEAYKPLLPDGETGGKEKIRRIEKRAILKLKQAIAQPD